MTTKNNLNDFALIDEQFMSQLEQASESTLSISVCDATDKELEQCAKKLSDLLQKDPSFDIDIYELQSVSFKHSSREAFNMGYQGANLFAIPIAGRPIDIKAPFEFPYCHIKVKCDFEGSNKAILDNVQARKQVFFFAPDLAKSIKARAMVEAYNFQQSSLDKIDGAVWYDCEGWQELGDNIDTLLHDAACEFGGSWFSLEQLEFVANSLGISFFSELAYLLTVDKVIKY